MGTNFYWTVPDVPAPATVTLPDGTAYTPWVLDAHAHWDPRVHIGKRSAAGRWCFSCGVTLCKGGLERIHFSADPDDDWHRLCPRCESDDDVRPTCSFTWAQDPLRVRTVCRAHGLTQVVIDEYGRRYTGQDFLALLDRSVTVEMMDSIGERFC